MKFIYKKLKEQKGAMDKILVTLLFVIVGVVGTIGLKTWVNTQENSLVETANGYINTSK